MAEIILRGISKSFGPNQAVRGLDLGIADGEFVVLWGRPGRARPRRCG